MADPLTAEGTIWGTLAVAAGVVIATVRHWWNKDKVDSSSATNAQAYNAAATGIVQRLESEIKGLSARLDNAERERDDCNARYRQLQTVMLEMARKMCAVRGLEDMGNMVINQLQSGEWGDDGSLL